MIQNSIRCMQIHPEGMLDDDADPWEARIPSSHEVRFFQHFFFVIPEGSRLHEVTYGLLGAAFMCSGRHMDMLGNESKHECSSACTLVAGQN